jgi:hypothetical protein
MRSASEIQERAEQCAIRAQAVTDPTDRAKWLQLAEQWALLGRLTFHSPPGARNEPGGFWRGGQDIPPDPRLNGKEA